MNIIFLLAPFSVLLGLVAVGAFVWTLRAGQYDDIAGSAARTGSSAGDGCGSVFLAGASIAISSASSANASSSSGRSASRTSTEAFGN